MEGRGECTHSSGRIQKGSFRRNFLVIGECFINPLDDVAQQEKTVSRLMKEVHISKDKLD